MASIEEQDEVFPGVVIEWLSGYCPVQAEGTIGGQPFYFRARHHTITLGIGGDNPVTEPAWEWAEDYYEQGEEGAGYLPHNDARQFIVRFAQMYQQGEPGNGQAYHNARRIATLRKWKKDEPTIFDSLPTEMKALVKDDE